MKRSVPIFFLLVLFLLFASCGKPAEPEATTAVENTEDAMHLIKMPVGFVRNKQEIAEPEYSHSMLNRFEAEAALPEGRKTVNKKTEDVTPLSVYNRSLAQLFIYGSGATDASLNADFLFFVRGGALSSVFGPEELGAAPERFVIHALYAADFNKDEIYEIYLNAQSGSSGRHIVAGVDLKNDSLIPVAYEGSSYMHSFEDRLFLIQVPEGGTSADAVCVSPVLENGALVPNTTASQEMVFAALNNWKLNQ